MSGKLLVTSPLPEGAPSDAGVVSLAPSSADPGLVQVLVDGELCIRQVRVRLEQGGEPALAWEGALTWDYQPHAGAARGERFFVVGLAASGAALAWHAAGAGELETKALELAPEGTSVDAPQRLLSHLQKVPPSEEEINFRKRQRRDLNA